MARLSVLVAGLLLGTALGGGAEQRKPDPAATRASVLATLKLGLAEDRMAALERAGLPSRELDEQVRILAWDRDRQELSARLQSLLPAAEFPEERAVIGQALEALGDAPGAAAVALDLSRAGWGEPDALMWAAHRLKKSGAKDAADKAFRAARLAAPDHPAVVSWAMLRDDGISALDGVPSASRGDSGVREATTTPRDDPSRPLKPPQRIGLIQEPPPVAGTAGDKPRDLPLLPLAALGAGIALFAVSRRGEPLVSDQGSEHGFDSEQTLSAEETPFESPEQQARYHEEFAERQTKGQRLAWSLMLASAATLTLYGLVTTGGWILAQARLAAGRWGWR